MGMGKTADPGRYAGFSARFIRSKPGEAQTQGGGGRYTGRGERNPHPILASNAPVLQRKKPRRLHGRRFGGVVAVRQDWWL